MILALALAACTTDDTGKEEEVAAPTVSWLSPADGDPVTAGDVACSVVVEHFTLQDPAKHNEGEAIGHLAILVDDTNVLETGSTTFNLTLAAGAHTLAAQLYYEDGDEVMATTEHLCDEDDTDSACTEVVATIAVTVE